MPSTWPACGQPGARRDGTQLWKKYTLLEKRSAEMPGSVVPNSSARLCWLSLRSCDSLPERQLALAINSAFLLAAPGRGSPRAGGHWSKPARPHARSSVVAEGQRHQGGSGTRGCASRSGEAEAAAQGCVSSPGMGEDVGHVPSHGPAHPLTPATTGTDGPEWGVGSEWLRYCRI